MNLSMPEVRVGEPMRCDGLTVFPLYSERSLFSPDYILAHEAMALGTVTVREVSSVGSVPDLLVENNGDMPCLLLEGTELRGQKQHRMLNTTALVGGRARHESRSRAWSTGVGGRTPRSPVPDRIVRRRSGACSKVPPATIVADSAPTRSPSGLRFAASTAPWA